MNMFGIMAIKHRAHQYGDPGAGPRALAFRRTIAAWGWLGAGVSAGFVAWGLEGGWPVFGFPALGVLLQRRMRAMSARARAGSATERMVAGRISRVRPTAVLFNLRLSGVHGDIDAVVLGPMAAIVEVKRAAGRVRVSRDLTLTVGRRPLHGRPIERSLAAAGALRERTGLPFDAIICVSDMTQRPRRIPVGPHELTICSSHHLPHILRRLQRVVQPFDARRLARSLVDDRTRAGKGVDPS